MNTGKVEPVAGDVGLPSEVNRQLRRMKGRALTFREQWGPEQGAHRTLWEAQAGKRCEGHETLVRQVVDAEGCPGMLQAVSELLAAPEGCCLLREPCKESLFRRCPVVGCKKLTEHAAS